MPRHATMKRPFNQAEGALFLRTHGRRWSRSVGRRGSGHEGLRSSASTSSRISQAGSALRYSSSVVRRHRPRGCSASCQKLYSRSPRRRTNGIRSRASRTSLIPDRSSSNLSPTASWARECALRSLTQASGFLPACLLSLMQLIKTFNAGNARPQPSPVIQSG